MAKSGIFVCLAALGAVNRFRSVPVAARTLVPLRRVGRIEVALGIVVLLLSAALVNLAPPSTAAVQPLVPATSVMAVGHDFGTSVRMALTVSPGSAGFDDFVATVTDYDSGEPSDATVSQLRFALASQSGVGPSSLAMAPDGPGRFTASGSNLSLDGIWTGDGDGDRAVRGGGGAAGPRDAGAGPGRPHRGDAGGAHHLDRPPLRRRVPSRPTSIRARRARTSST